MTHQVLLVIAYRRVIMRFFFWRDAPLIDRRVPRLPPPPPPAGHPDDVRSVCVKVYICGESSRRARSPPRRVHVAHGLSPHLQHLHNSPGRLTSVPPSSRLLLSPDRGPCRRHRVSFVFGRVFTGAADSFSPGGSAQSSRNRAEDHNSCKTTRQTHKNIQNTCVSERIYHRRRVESDRHRRASLFLHVTPASSHRVRVGVRLLSISSLVSFFC